MSAAKVRILAAAKQAPTMLVRNMATFEAICDLVLEAPDSEKLAVAFAIAIFPRSKALRHGLGVNYRGRQAVSFVRQIERLALAIGVDAPKRLDALGALAEAAELQIQRYGRSGARHDEPRTVNRVFGTYVALCDTLENAGAPEASLNLLRQPIQQLRGRPQRPSE